MGEAKVEDVTERAVKDALEVLDSRTVGLEPRIAALAVIRKATAGDTPALAELACSAGIVRVLCVALQQWDVGAKLEAAWCLSNIAAGSDAHTEAACAAAPYLVALLTSGNPLLAEHAAWGLGNLATTPDSRAAVMAAGAMQPLVDCIVAGLEAELARVARADPASPPSTEAEEPRVVVARVAAWAATNLLHRTAKALPFLAAGLAPALAKVYSALWQAGQGGGVPGPTLPAFSRPVLFEVAWLSAYIAAREEAAVQVLVESGAMGAALGLLAAQHPPLVVPALRLLGNIAGCGVPAWNEALVSGPGLLQALGQLLEGGAAQGGTDAQQAFVFRLEAMWVLGQLAVTHAGNLVAGGLVPAMSRHLTPPWHLLTTTMTALYNILRHGATAPVGGGSTAPTGLAMTPTHTSSVAGSTATATPAPPQPPAAASSDKGISLSPPSLTPPPFLRDVLDQPGVLQAFIDGLNKPDLSVVHRCLSVVDMALRFLPDGAQRVEMMGGVDALSTLVMRGPGDSSSVEVAGLTSEAEALSSWAEDLYDRFFTDSDGEGEHAAELPQGQLTLGAWASKPLPLAAGFLQAGEAGSPEPATGPRVPKTANLPAWATKGSDPA